MIYFHWEMGSTVQNKLGKPNFLLKTLSFFSSSLTQKGLLLSFYLYVKQFFPIVPVCIPYLMNSGLGALDSVSTVHASTEVLCRNTLANCITYILDKHQKYFSLNLKCFPIIIISCLLTLTSAEGLLARSHSLNGTADQCLQSCRANIECMQWNFWIWI